MVATKQKVMRLLFDNGDCMEFKKADGVRLKGRQDGLWDLWKNDVKLATFRLRGVVYDQVAMDEEIAALPEGIKNLEARYVAKAAEVLVRYLAKNDPNKLLQAEIAKAFKDNLVNKRGPGRPKKTVTEETKPEPEIRQATEDLKKMEEKTDGEAEGVGVEGLKA